MKIYFPSHAFWILMGSFMLTVVLIIIIVFIVTRGKRNFSVRLLNDDNPFIFTLGIFKTSQKIPELGRIKRHGKNQILFKPAQGITPQNFDEKTPLSAMGNGCVLRMVKSDQSYELHIKEATEKITDTIDQEPDIVMVGDGGFSFTDTFDGPSEPTKTESFDEHLDMEEDFFS